MEWVETTARTVDEAKELALDELGVAEDDAEIVVVDEPKAGLFGRLRGEARVRARVRPTQARPKVEHRDRRKGKARDGRDQRDPDAASDAAPSSAAPVAVAAAAESGESSDRPPNGRRGAGSSGRSDEAAATDKESTVSAAEVGAQAREFVEELVAAFGLRGETTLTEDGDDLEVQVSGDDLGLLVGPRGATLLAVQDLARVASQRRLGDHSTRLRVDVGGYRVRRREALTRFAVQVADEVRASGEPRALEPMPSSDRKVVHEALLDAEGVSTRSEGDDPHRRVIIDPAPAS
jgi:spoIIIJ-associated protein